MSQKKYEITEAAHPKYPWLHRIRAIRQVNEQVSPGMLGGYVQTEDNLSQEGTCWIYDQAVCCEEAAVADDGRMFDSAVARGSALVGGDARMFERAMAEGNSSFFSGELKGCKARRKCGSPAVRQWPVPADWGKEQCLRNRLRRVCCQ